MTCLLSRAYAGDVVISGFTVTGFRSTVDDYEDEDEARDYEYRNYSLRMKHTTSEFVSYDIVSYFYSKNYRQEDDLDNISKILKGSFSYLFDKTSDNPVHLGIRMKYKEKRYDNEPLNEYDLFSVSPTVTFRKDRRSTLKFTAMVQNVNYIHAQEKDHVRLSAKIAGTHYPPHRRLKLVASYKIESLTEDQIDREKTKHDIFGGFDYIFNHPALDKILTRVSWGQRDTKDDDVRDIDYDYEYHAFSVKTLHTVKKHIELGLKYHYYRKDYINTDLDHTSMSVMNTWRYVIRNNTSERITLGMKAAYKDMDYDLKPDSSYEKNSIEIITGYQKKKNWKTSGTVKGDFFDYHNPDKDRNRYAVRINGEKQFLYHDLSLSLALTYRYIDYAQGDDDNHGSAKIAFSYTF